MTLLKRGNVWWSYIYVDGVRHQQSTGTSNRKRAESIEARFKEELNSRRFGIVEADPNMKFDELAARFMAGASCRPHHLYHLRFLLPFFAGCPVLRITKSLAEEFRKARRAHNPVIKDATVNRDLGVLRHILYWAADEQLIAANPLARLKMARERRTRRQILSIAEEQSLLGVAKGHLRTMLILALDSGMRRGEITNQTWEDVDFSQNALFVTHSKTPEGESREIPLTSRLRDLLTQIRQPEGLIIGFRGKPVRIIKRTWQTALRNAQIRHVRFHDLRHTFNTRLMEAGVLQEVRMALMGHSPGSKVHATYTHIELPVKREAIRKLEEWKIHQQDLLTEQTEQDTKDETDARAETERSESATVSPAASGQAGAQTVEEKEPRGGGPGTSRQAQGRDRRDGRGDQNQAQAAPEVRGGPQALRRKVAP